VTDEMRGEFGSLSQQVYYRFYSVDTRNPGSWNAGGTPRTTDGGDVQDIDISATTDQMWVQVALRGKVASGSEAEALSAIQAGADADPSVIAARRFTLNPTTNSAKDTYLPLAAPQGAAGLSSMMFGMKVTGLDGTTVKLRPAYRAFTSDVQAPGPWNDLDSLQTLSTETLYNSGTLSPALGTVMFWQPGLKIVGNDARATVQVMVVAVWG
jgi:hypothetical protein